MQTVTYAPGPTAPITNKIQWLLVTSAEKVEAFIEHTLADWLLMNYPDYDYYTWLRSKSLRTWWWQQWYLYDALFLKELKQVSFDERWEWYRMLHQYPFSHTDSKAKQLLADFETNWRTYVAEIEAHEQAL